MNDSSHAAQALVPLLEAARAVEERLEKRLDGVGLSKGKLKVLTKLVEAGDPLPLSALAERCRCVRSNVTQLVDRLEAEGLVRRVDDPTDRRSILAELTKEGKERQVSGERLLHLVEQEVGAELPLEVRTLLAALAAKWS